METLWVILVGLVTAVALFLFYCKGWWPSTWWRGFCFVMLTLIFTPFITLPIQYVIWMIWFEYYLNPNHCKHTKGEKENPMPECPKRVKIERQMTELTDELTRIDYELAKRD